MAANPDPSTTPPADPQPPSGNGSHPEPAASAVPTMPVKPAVPAAANAQTLPHPPAPAKTPSIETVAKCLEAKVIEARVVEPNVLEVKLLVEQAAKKDWKTTWWARLLISIGALVLAATMLFYVLSIFSVSQTFPYTEWMMYRFQWHELALFLFCLLLVSGVSFFYTAQSLLKNSLEGKGPGGTAFNLNFGAVALMGGISLLGLVILTLTSTCDQPFVTFQVEGRAQEFLNGEAVDIPVNTWRKVTAVADQDSYGRLLCNWIPDKNTQISEKKTCTIFVRPIALGGGGVTLNAHSDVCNSPEQDFNLAINGVEP